MKDIYEYGQIISFNPLETSEKEKKEILDRLIEMANECLPSGVTYFIVEKFYDPSSEFQLLDFGKTRVPTKDYLKHHGVAWYHNTLTTEDGHDLFLHKLGIWDNRYPKQAVVGKLRSAGKQTEYSESCSIDEMETMEAAHERHQSASKKGVSHGNP